MRVHLPVAKTTRAVVFGRGFLWFSIAAVIALLVYTAVDNSTSDGARLVFSQMKAVGNIQNVMTNPYYHGLDKDNLPYSVLATQATQQDADTVLLENIKADMSTKNGQWLALHAGAGELKTSAKTLMLTKNVDMFYDGGYEFRSERAFVDINKGSASGDMPITGQGPMGTLRANRFSVLNRGEVIIFEGAVKVVIYRD